MNCKPMIFAAALIANVVISTHVQAQPVEAEYAPDYIIVKVHPGVAPMQVPDVGMSLRYIAEHDLPPDTVEVAEVLMAVTLQICGVTSIEPMIKFPFKYPDLAAETGIDRFYTISVPEGADVAYMVEQLTPFDTHLELISLDWYGEFAGAPPNDTLFTDLWYLDNFGQGINADCPVSPGCICAVGAPPGTAGSDISALEAWSLETGVATIVVAVIDTGADLEHEDLVNQLVQGQNFADGDPNDASETTGHSHGTGVAGVIVAEGNNNLGVIGVSNGSKVMPFKDWYRCPRTACGCNCDYMGSRPRGRNHQYEY